MNYEIITDGSSVMIDVLACADVSLVGLEFGIFKFIKIKFEELNYLIMQLMGEREYSNFSMSLLYNHIIPFDNLIVLQTVFTDVDSEEIFAKENLMKISLLDMMKLFVSKSIYSCYQLSYKISKEGKFVPTIRDSAAYNPINSLSENAYVISEEQKKKFKSWYENYYNLMCLPRNDWFSNAFFSMYCISFRIGIIEPAFITLFTILESLFCKHEKGIKERISKGTAILISDNQNEVDSNTEKLRTLYKKRSDYVHEGKPIEYKDLEELQEIVRKVLLELMNRGLHKKEFNRSKFVQEIFNSGYPLKYRLL